MPHTNMRALGRLGEPLQGGLSGQRRRRQRASRGAVTLGYVARRRRVPPVGLGIAVAVVVGLAWLGSTAHSQTVALDELANKPAIVGPLSVKSVPQRPDVASAVSRGEVRSATPVFAVVDGLRLSLPYPDPLLVAFHEAARPEALTLVPVGKLTANDNTTRFTPAADTQGPDYRVLSSRGRARDATSAVDVAVPQGASAAAPVSGKVVDVRQYPLSAGVQDWRVAIEPTGRPDLQVVMIHLHAPTVAVGDSVVAGETPIATVRTLPFDSQIDYALNERLPHTHIEVKSAVQAEPLDPNAPALPASEVAANS